MPTSAHLLLHGNRHYGERDGMYGRYRQRLEPDIELQYVHHCHRLAFDIQQQQVCTSIKGSLKLSISKTGKVSKHFVNRLANGSRNNSAK